MDRDDGEPEVEVLAEAALLHLRGEVAVGRRDEANVDGARRARADRLHLPLLQHAQELRLERRRDLADLVEEERAARGALEDALAVAVGAGERALHVAEELGLEHRLAERLHVQRHEGPLGAIGGVVDRAGDSPPCRCRSRR